MPGDLFLDALKNKEKLRKGYPLGEGRIVKEEGWNMRGNAADYPADKDLYRAPNILQRAIGRLQAAVRPERDPTLQSNKNISARKEAEQIPEAKIERSEYSIVNQGVKKERN